MAVSVSVQDDIVDKIEKPAKLKRIQERLTEALSDPECRPAKVARKTPAPKKSAKGAVAKKSKKKTAKKKPAARKKTPSARRRPSKA